MSAYTKVMQLAEELMQVHNGHSDEGPTTFSEAATELRILQSQRDELLEYLQYAVWAHPELEKNEKLVAVIAKATGKAEQN